MKTASLPPPAVQHVGAILAERESCDVVSMLERMLVRHPRLKNDSFFLPLRLAIVLLGAPSADRCRQELVDRVINTPSIEIAALRAERILESALYLAQQAKLEGAVTELERNLTAAAVTHHRGSAATPEDFDLRLLARHEHVT